jgi:hypothetical protein
MYLPLVLLFVHGDLAVQVLQAGVLYRWNLYAPFLFLRLSL